MTMLNKEKLMLYIKKEFPGTIDNHWNWDLLENVIDYGIEYKNYTKEQLLMFLNNMIPEITEDEIMKFME